MTRGGLIFAHNSREVDYALLALISGGLAKKHLNIPVSIATDDSTVAWMKTSGIWDQVNSVFEHVIIIDRPTTLNSRRLSDGQVATHVPFINSTRASAWDITPYDQTLLLDSDFLVFSDSLNNYWDIDASIKISCSMNDIRGDRVGALDKRVSDTGIHMYWATNVMFDKTEESKSFFDFVKMVRDNYDQYGDIYRFDTRQYRNDIAFSVVKHLLDGFTTDLSTTLPPLLTVTDRDMLVDIKGDNLLFLVMDPLNTESFTACSVNNTDVHIMNKQSIIRNKDKLLELI